MSCEYCERGKNMKRDTCSDVSIAKINGARYILYSDGYRGGATEPIKFCPMCGEPFPEIVQDSLESIKDDIVLNVCRYAKKRGVGHGRLDSDEEAICTSCEWVHRNCNQEMRMDLADRLDKLINEEDKHDR